MQIHHNQDRSVTEHGYEPQPRANQTPQLAVRSLCKSFGALQVAKDLDLEFNEGDRTALIGPNGAGKTTFVNLITGAFRPTSGRVELEGRDITRLDQYRRVRAGIGRTFQITSLFREMTVFENVYLAVSERRGTNRNIFKRAWSDLETCREAMGILKVLELGDHAESRLSMLSYGRQRLVELAIALAIQPKLLLLDEPAAGIPERETAIVLRGLDRLPPQISILMIDHDMDLVFRFARRIIVLVEGAIYRVGAPSEIANDADVKRLYLGERSV